MERIIDISNKDGRLWAEDAGYLSDFTAEEGYLFSVAISYHQKPACRIFHKDYQKAQNPFQGKYYITLPTEYDAELHCTKDYNHYVDYNLDEFDGERCVRSDYQGTLTIDLDAMTATYKNEEHHFCAIIKEEVQESRWQRQHENSFAQPY